MKLPGDTLHPMNGRSFLAASPRLIRDLSGEVDCAPKGKWVHVDAADYIAMPHKGALAIVAPPDTPFNFLFPPTDRTPARCSPLRTGEALDVGKLGIADEQATNPLGTAKANHGVGTLMTLVADLAALPRAGFSSSCLQAPITARSFLASVTFLGNLAEHLVVPPLEGADAPTGDHQSCSRIGVHSCLVDLAEVHGGMGRARSLLRRSSRN
jgi:hypothetical protein